MSTWIYLQCVAHEPAIEADGESGQHLYDLPRIREEIARRDEYANAIKIGAQFPDHFTQNTAQFLHEHPKCPIRIMDEYGEEHALEEGEE